VVAIVIETIAADLDLARGIVLAVGVGAVDVTVTVVVDAVGTRLGRAVRDRRVGALAGGAGVRGAGLLVVTLGGRLARDAGWIRGAGVVIVAVGRGVAGNAGRVRCLVAADAGGAQVGGAGVVIVAIGGRVA